MRKTIIVVAVVIFLAILGGLAVFGMPTDTGITACRQMADRQASGQKSSGPMTEESYKKARTPFEGSAYSDLRIAGTDFVDAVWESQKALDSDETPLATSLGVLTKVHARYASLKIACERHGVALKEL